MNYFTFYQTEFVIFQFLDMEFTNSSFFTRLQLFLFIVRFFLTVYFILNEQPSVYSDCVNFYRSVRGGRRKQRTIPVHLGHRSPKHHNILRPPQTLVSSTYT